MATRPASSTSAYENAHLQWSLDLHLLLQDTSMTKMKLSLGSVFDNQGQEFIVAFMENTDDMQNLELFVATIVDRLVNVTVSTPKYSGNAYLNQHFQISRGNTTMVSIDVELRMKGTSLSPKGILIQATDEVIVYGVNRQHNTNDAFLGLPVDVLGNEYYAVSYLPTVKLRTPPQYAQLMVVATVDGTQVEITFPDSNDFDHVSFDGKDYYGGQTLTVTLNRCVALQLQTEGYYDLTGAYLKSDKPVAFFSGNVRAVVGAAGSSDHLVEQLISTDRWGKRFVIVPIPERAVGDFFKVIGNTDATEVDFTCISSTSMITSDKILLAKAGSYQLVEMNPKSYCYIVANNSIFIGYFVKSQYNRDNHDPALILIPPIEQYAAEYVFATPKKTVGSYENFFLFVVKDKDKAGLRLDEEPFPSTIDYVSIPNSSLVAGYMVVEDGFHKFNHISPISVFGGIMYGRYTYETYGLPVGLRMAKINKNTSTQHCDALNQPSSSSHDLYLQHHV
ncbi:IgGFc-binding protein [Mizuhopecten yessoensis]|uniref:IgGFc-binding protein n=1 Tax=Mizuhopecten yessoensis TaxID=6573 RepID=A0A210R756_MIZYE|nr:IgGFc-binding protein [Mizuhopecten yessoensis]